MKTIFNIIGVAAMAIAALPATVMAVPQDSPLPHTHAGTQQTAQQNQEEVKKVLLVGDSMTGWMGERLEAYGRQNGFEVATVVWDGSTINKWGGSATRLADIIKKEKPDVVMVSLGLNELLEKNPSARYSGSLEKIRKAVGDVPLLWVGPPSWPGKGKGEALNTWLSTTLGDGNYFRSADLTIGRQSGTNPHPSRAGMNKWVDALVEWIPANTDLHFPGLDKPTGAQNVRGKTFIYKKMKETL